jgi:hypothetical protein
MVQPRNVREMAARLGNPLYFHVKQPNEGTRHKIDKLFAGETPKEIPQDAWHLVLVDTYFGTIQEDGSYLFMKGRTFRCTKFKVG